MTRKNYPAAGRVTINYDEKESIKKLEMELLFSQRFKVQNYTGINKKHEFS